MYQPAPSQLGVAPVIVQAGANVAQNIVGSLIGGSKEPRNPIAEKYGLNNDQYDTRFQNDQNFRALWRRGYFQAEGKNELPSNMTTHDFYVRTFGRNATLDPLVRDAWTWNEILKTNPPASLALTAASGLSQADLDNFWANAGPLLGIDPNVPPAPPVATSPIATTTDIGAGGFAFPLILAAGLAAILLIGRR